jgi:hypothetical protein
LHLTAGATPWPFGSPEPGHLYRTSSGKDRRYVKTTSMTLLAALALGALAPSLASAQTARPAAHSAGKAVTGKATARKATVSKTQKKKVTCRYQVRHGKKVRVCR